MQVQPVTTQNNYKIRFPKFRGVTPLNIKPIQANFNVIEKAAESPIFCTIADIKNYLKINSAKIESGKIFNTPVTKDRDSLLMAFLHIKPIKEEKEDYETILNEMANMTAINYDQKDSMDITALEWVMMSENSKLLSLMKEQKLTQDPMLFNVYKNIKNPEFKKELLESGVYTPPVYETEEEQKIAVESIIHRKYPFLYEPYYTKEVRYAVNNIFLKPLRNNEGKISGETMNIFKRIIDLAEYGHLGTLYKGLPLLKNEKGDIDTEKAAEFLAKYEKLDFSRAWRYGEMDRARDYTDTTINEALISVIKNYDIHEVKGIFDIFGIDCKVKDGGIVLNSDYISVPAYQGSRKDIDMDLKIRHYDIDENKLLKNVTHIYGYMNLNRNKRVTSLPNLKYALNLSLDESQVTDLPKLEKAHTLYLKNSLITCLPELSEVTHLYVKDAQIMNLPGIRNVTNQQQSVSKIIYLPKIQEVSYLYT